MEKPELFDFRCLCNIRFFRKSVKVTEIVRVLFQVNTALAAKLQEGMQLSKDMASLKGRDKQKVKKVVSFLFFLIENVINANLDSVVSKRMSTC